MSWVCEIAITGSAEHRAHVEQWLSRTGVPKLTALENLRSLDAYSPTVEEGRDPYSHQMETPLLLLIVDFASEAALGRALSAGLFREALDALPENLLVFVSAFRRTFHPPAEDGRLDASISYVVRYTRPAADEAHFVRHYLDSHPNTQSRLPNIRAVMCYLPLPGLTAAGRPSMDYLIGNEVAFDSVEDFNTAMQSPAREELRSLFRDSSAFFGTNTHFLMKRRRFCGASKAA